MLYILTLCAGWLWRELGGKHLIVMCDTMLIPLSYIHVRVFASVFVLLCSVNLNLILVEFC